MKKTSLLKRIDDLTSKLNRQNAKVSVVLSQNEQLIKMNEKLLLMLEEMAYENEQIRQTSQKEIPPTTSTSKESDFIPILLKMNNIGNYELN